MYFNSTDVLSPTVLLKFRHFKELGVNERCRNKTAETKAMLGGPPFC
jgi:hypothetical protein